MKKTIVLTIVAVGVCFEQASSSQTVALTWKDWPAPYAGMSQMEISVGI